MSKKFLHTISFVLVFIIAIAGCIPESIPIMPQPTNISATYTTSTAPSPITIPSLFPTVVITPTSKPSFQGVIAIASFSRKYSAIALLDLVTDQIKNFPSSIIGASPSWSPDGRWLAGIGSITPESQESDIYKVRIDGSEFVRLTNKSPQGKGQLDWSPDGHLIAYEYTDTIASTGIAVVSADGLTSVNLINDGAYSPTWSPDSKQIAYMYLEKDGSSLELWVMDADGKNTRLLREFPYALGGNVDWSPDGKWLALIYGKSPDSTDMVCNEIYLIRPDGSDLTRLTDLMVSSKCAEHVIWSPDSNYLAFDGRDITSGQVNITNKGAQIYILDILNKNIFAVTDEQDWFITEIDWSYTVNLK